jgi:hypothetical protein
MVTEELDPGLFGYATQSAEQRDLRVNEFIELLRSAVAVPGGPAARPAPGPAS